MSLNWNLSEIKNWKTLCWIESPDDPEKKRLKPLTENIIWTLACVDLPSLESDKDIRECLWRYEFCCQVNGELWTEKLTREDLEKHKGLSINASRKTRQQFIKKNIDTAKRAVDWKISKAYQEVI